MKAFVEFHKKLGMAYREVGEEEKERKELNRALKLSYLNNNPDFYVISRLADFYLKEDDLESLNQLYQEAINQYNRVIDITDTSNPQLYVSLATLYAKIGEKEKAKETVQIISKIAPHLKSAVQKMLEAIEYR
jgi:tetratricopeptide (TPR) repeat protein